MNPDDDAEVEILTTFVCDQIEGFAAEMSRQMIHLGLAAFGAEVRCVYCGESWPCEFAREMERE